MTAHVFRLKPVLCASVLMVAQISAALADGAVVMTASICQDPADSMDSLWLTKVKGATSVFFMKDTGDVVALDGAGAFDTFKDIYVAAHGSRDEVWPFLKADFATNLKASHPSTPDLVYFSVCDAAVGTDTVLKLTNGQYVDAVKVLSGPKGACQLVGDGNPDITAAKNRYGAVQSADSESKNVQDNIMDIWDKQNYAGSGKTWAAACEQYVDNGDMASLNAFRLAVQNKFLSAPAAPVAKSHNYGLLIQWNTGGNDFFQCGQQNGVACP